MNVDYIKDYKDRELKQFVGAYFLVAVAATGFYTLPSMQDVGLETVLSKTLTIDAFIAAASVLVIIFNELWSDKVKTRILHSLTSLSVRTSVR